MTRRAGDGDGNFVAGIYFSGRFEDDGFELGGFAEPDMVIVSISGIGNAAYAI